MKILTLFLLLSTASFTQTIPDTCFTKQQVLDISITLDSLYVADELNNSLIIEQQKMIEMQRNLIKLDSLQLAYQKQQIELLNDNIDLYIKRQKQLQPKWYDSKGLWFGSGLVTAILTAFSISSLVN
jgi:hypothetical protein